MISDQIKVRTLFAASLYAACGLVVGPVVQAQQSEELPRLQPDMASPNVVPQRLVEPTNVPDFPTAIYNYTPAEVSNTNSPELRIRDNTTESGTSINRQTYQATPKLPYGSSRSPSVPGNASSTEQENVTTSGNATPLQSGLQSTTLPVQTHLKLILETSVDAKASEPGDIFEAHVRDDLYVGQSLLLARGSLIRGRVFTIQRPRLVSRAARVNLRLEQIVTPMGEVIPLDAALSFSKGKTNVKGELDPGTNFGTRVSSNVKAATGANATGPARGALVAANVATLGAPAVAAAIGGSAIALFKSGDNVDLKPGDEIEVLLTNDLGLQIN